ncbi:Maf family nucleotide pyrophosphatase [Daejeonella sp.]|uniref:Maf family nucleotide pyrophosphatase n=1 Tax=Daejeonella sp. TaxID=2805397 RepID=UPI0037846AB7
MLKNTSPIILASKSPRRQELLHLMGIDFKVVLRDVDESYPAGLSPSEIAVYIAEKKAKAFDEVIDNEIVITADTIVSLDGKILGKPQDDAHAFEILSDLSGKRHEVITAVSLLKNHKLISFYEISEVFFKTLSAEQIKHYISTYSPMDKAGAYGIQEWIGLVAVEKINGSYSNIVGLPTQRLYEELCKLMD